MVFSRRCVQKNVFVVQDRICQIPCKSMCGATSLSVIATQPHNAAHISLHYRVQLGGV